MSLNIIELEIDDSLTGDTFVSEIALVMYPAIETEFLYFNKQNMDVDVSALEPYITTTGTTEDFVKPRSGESEDDFISRCFKVVKSEGKSRDQALAICYSYWKDRFDEDCGCDNKEDDNLYFGQGFIDGMPVFENAEDAELYGEVILGCEGYNTKNIDGEEVYLPCKIDSGMDMIEDKGVELEDLLKEGYKIVGAEIMDEKSLKKVAASKFSNVSDEEFYRIISTPSEDSILDYGGRKTRFVYMTGTSPKLIRTSREFCRRMLGGRQFVFRYEDVVSLSTQIEGEADNYKIIPRPQGSSVDIFAYKGGANCRHYWMQIILQPPLGTDEDVEVNNNARRMIEKSVSQGPAPGLAGNVNPPVNYGNRSGASVFNKERFSYNDYPEAAKQNACKVLKWRDEYGDEVNGMTRVGWTRANQLCSGENITEETIARMSAFERHRKNADIAEEYKGTPWKDAGYVAWLGWGGDEGISWAKRKLEQIRKEDFVETADGLSIGDYVSWTYAGRSEGDDRARGQIKEIRVQGKLKVPGTDFELSPTEERPAALIETKDGSLVGQYIDNLRKIQKPEDFNDTIIPDGFLQGLAIFKDKDKAKKYSEYCGCGGSIEEVLYMDQVMYQSCSYSDNKFSKHQFKLNDEKRIIYSPAMKPGILIPRLDEVTGEKYFVTFKENTIRKMSQRFLIDKRTDKTNYEHTDQKFENVFLVESWIVEGEKDKAYQLGYKTTDIPKGTWMVGYRVDNDEVWSMVKDGKVKGVSIEGNFEHSFSKNKQDEYLLEEIINILNQIK